jgi:transcriptional regulator with XRE-family HTH domain
MNREVAILEAFGNNVATRRRELGLSQEGLAERAGLHRTYVGSVERGERNPALKSIVKIALALGVDPGDLLKGVLQ